MNQKPTWTRERTQPKLIKRPSRNLRLPDQKQRPRNNVNQLFLKTLPKRAKKSIENINLVIQM